MENNSTAPLEAGAPSAEIAQGTTLLEGQAQQAEQQAPAGDTPAAEQQTQQPEQQQAEGEQEGEGKPEGAPESYDFATPEGVMLDDQVVGAFSDVAKELNLSQESAQKILDKVAPLMAQRQTEAVETARNEWAEASKIDKEFGGDRLNENLAVAKKAMDQFATPELRTLLNESGLGNHPEVIRFFYRAGKAISEDSFVVGGNAQSNEQSVAQRLYPNMNP